jgi:hypothetical protein
MNKRGRRGQVWLETVIYTMIAFVMIGLVLTYAKPKIEEMQDSAILKQSTEIMKEIDSTILTMGATGNKRILEINIKKGNLRINGTTDAFIFDMDSRNAYTEPGLDVHDGSVVVHTIKKSGYNTVTLTLNYSNNYNITYNGEDKDKLLSKAATSYRISISNDGEELVSKKIKMDVRIL